METGQPEATNCNENPMSWLEPVRNHAKFHLAVSPIFINFAILGKDQREFPRDCDSFGEI